MDARDGLRAGGTEVDPLWRASGRADEEARRSPTTWRTAVGSRRLQSIHRQAGRAQSRACAREPGIAALGAWTPSMARAARPARAMPTAVRVLTADSAVGQFRSRTFWWMVLLNGVHARPALDGDEHPDRMERRARRESDGRHARRRGSQTGLDRQSRTSRVKHDLGDQKSDENAERPEAGHESDGRGRHRGRRPELGHEQTEAHSGRPETYGGRGETGLGQAPEL